MDIATIITLVLTAIATIFAGFWLKAKGKLGQLKTLIKEAADIVTVAVDALNDNQITNDEIEDLKLQVTEFKAALKALLGKS